MKIKARISRVLSGKYNFIVFIVLSVSIACVLVGVSMSIYNSSGAAQLDLSRPGYVSVRSKATNTNNSYKEFSSAGPISISVITDFENQFNERSKKITAANVFSGDPLDPEALGIGAVF